MSNAHGAFVWHELMTTNPKAAATFYSTVVGWSCRDAEMPGMPYWMFSIGDAMIGGLMNIPEDASKIGAPPNWSGYVSVDDVDVAAAKLKTLGGRIIREPADIPNVGRFAVVTDPQGAYFSLIKWTDPQQSQETSTEAPGRVGWNELYAVDIVKAFAFYADMFGWTEGEAIDMGPMGKYQLFNHDGKTIGGMMNKPPNIPVAMWGYYFNVPDIDSAVARVTTGGGRIVNGPMQVPGGAWIAQGTDPQGAFFALSGKRMT